MRSLLIAIADDDPDVLENLAAWLGSQGHKVHTTADGVDALFSVLGTAPDVVILDIGMPKLSGVDVVLKTRTAYSTRTPVFVAISGHDDPERIRAAKAAGFDHYLVKPADLEELKRILEDAARR